MQDNPAIVGTVQDVAGALVRATRVTDGSNLVFIDGQSYRVGQVGSFVRIPIGFIDLFGVISQVGAGAAPENLVDEEPYGKRWIMIQLIGEGGVSDQFQRGISQYPNIGDTVHIVTEKDLSRIYGRPELPNYVSIGKLAGAESIPALVDINKLLSRHVAIVGSTGAGKSTTVAGILRNISSDDQFSSARIVLLDVHGEYGAALRDRAAIFKVNANTARNELPLYIPFWAMNFDELMDVTFGKMGDAERAAVLEKVVELKEKSLSEKSLNGVSLDNLTVDSPVPFSIHQLWFELHCLVNATHYQSGNQNNDTMAYELDDDGNKIEPGDAQKVIPPKFLPHTSGGDRRVFLSQSPLNLRRPLENLASKLRDPRFGFLFLPGEFAPNLAGNPSQDLNVILKGWLGNQRITILDLSGVPNTVMQELVGALLRVIYDTLFWARNLSEGGRESPVLIVMEEAHSYLNSDENLSSAATAIERIVKEGRKYGIGAMVVSQRPSEISTTVLAQCGTFIAMRLTNSSDRAHVTGAVTDGMSVLLEDLPILRTGEAVLVGEAVHLPIRAVVTPPPVAFRPDSIDPLVYVPKAVDGSPQAPGGWDRTREESDYEDVLTVWRKQDPESPRKTANSGIETTST